MAVNSFNAQNPPVTTKGDVFTFSTIPTRLAVGANDTVLTADSTTATGLKWAAPVAASGPAFRVYRTSTNQTTTEDTYTKLQFNAETFDTDNCFDSTTNYRFTPNKAGYYSFQTGLEFGTYDSLYVRIYKNGVSNAQLYSGKDTAVNQFCSGSALIYANGTTDYFEIFAYLADSANRSFVQGEAISFFSGVWIRS